MLYMNLSIHLTMLGSLPSRSTSPVIASCCGQVSRHVQLQFDPNDGYLKLAINDSSQWFRLKTHNSAMNSEFLAFALDQKIRVLPSGEKPGRIISDLHRCSCWWTYSAAIEFILDLF